MGIGTEIALFFAGAGSTLGLAIVADRWKARRKRSRRLSAMEARMTAAWETAKIRMLWSAPGFMGPTGAGRSTKYRNLDPSRISGSTTANFSRYIGG